MHDETGRCYFFKRSPHLRWRLNFASRFWNHPYDKEFDARVGLQADYVILSGRSYTETTTVLTTAICREELECLCCCEWGLIDTAVQTYINGTIDSSSTWNRCRTHLFRLRAGGRLNDPSTGKFQKAMALSAK